ncbi:MAG: hypothetical protein A2Y23_01580 [Clostridiales bacterium GWB2_37_7]|nr:MAG: hypothetical protein A2Y23_01580 [Clostridiales bacterium GWB2_37_7]
MHMIDYTAATPETYFYILDVHGNVVALADENGNKVVNFEYDAWGNLTNTPEAVTTGNGELLRNANPFRYSGYQFDPESGLYYLKARYYSAVIGRFLSFDPIPNINRFRYVDNNPVSFIDPNGFAKDRGSQPLNDPWLQGKSEKELQEMYREEKDPVRKKKIQ